MAAPTYLAYRGAAVIARVLPRRLGERGAELAARAAAPLMPDRRAQVRRNMVRASESPLSGPSLDDAVAGAFASYGRYWFELFRLPYEARDLESIERRVIAEGYEHIAAGIDAGRGIILATPHVGGFEMAPAFLIARGLRPTVVVEPVEPPELFEWFARVRAEIGMEVVALGPDAGIAMSRALKDNRPVCLVSDRDLTGDGVSVEFFGEQTTLPAGPALLALRSQAPLLASAMYFRPHGMHTARVLAPVPAERRGRLREDIVRITQDLAHRFEELIRAEPAQWHLMQPNWPSDQRASREAGACA